MSDLASRLRDADEDAHANAWGSTEGFEPTLYIQAADHIEELERRIKELNNEISGLRRSWWDERMRLLGLGHYRESTDDGDPVG